MSFDPNSNSLLTDPEYLLKNPGYIKQAHDLLVQYGIIPPPGSAYGADAATAQEAAANPYSVAKMLQKGYQTSLGSNMNNANAHGALFSGAYQNNQLHSLDDYQQGVGQATQQLLGGLNQIGGDRTNTLVDIWQRLSQAPVTPDVTPTPAPPSAPAPLPIGQPTGVGTGTPTPQGPYQRTGPEAGSVAKKISKPKPVDYSGRAL